MSAPAAAHGAGKGQKFAPRMTEIARQLPPSEIPRISTRRSECCADLP